MQDRKVQNKNKNKKITDKKPFSRWEIIRDCLRFFSPPSMKNHSFAVGFLFYRNVIYCSTYNLCSFYSPTSAQPTCGSTRKTLILYYVVTELSCASKLTHTYIHTYMVRIGNQAICSYIVQKLFALNIIFIFSIGHLTVWAKACESHYYYYYYFFLRRLFFINLALFLLQSIIKTFVRRRQSVLEYSEFFFC